MRVAVTGAAGRLGRALVSALGEAPYTGPGGPLAWGRAEFDLDAPDAVGERLDRDRVEVVVHAAAWTDVDGCARDPATAESRNGHASGVLARACAARGLDLIVVSTNEVFDGKRSDGVGYGPSDQPAPANPYGASKLRGERAAKDAYADAARGQLAIVRTAWLFGPGRPDFPAKILAAAREAARTGEPLRVTGDEWGSPTYSVDLAEAIVEFLAEGSFTGIHHVVNGLFATRADWARYVVGRALLDVEIVNVPMSAWQRDSTPPRWGVLEPTPLPSGEPLRLWPDAMADYAPLLLRETAAGLPLACPVTGSTIPGVAYGSVDRHADERGSFRELWRRSRLSEPFVQANLSTSAAGVLRGLHLHRRQVDHWVVADGRAFVALVDVRPLLDGSAAQSIVETRELGADESVTIPVGVAHGFLAVEPLALLYLVTNEFDGSDELGFAWDDPEVGVPWPQVRGTADGRPILSGRDQSNPPLAELVARLRG